MFHDDDMCTFCGRFALEVESWAELVQPYRSMLATWDDEVTYFYGYYHHDCVRKFKRNSEFRAEMLGWICQGDHLITVRGGDGDLHDLRRIGLGYTDRVATLGAGEVFEDHRFNSWVFAEYAGPVHFLTLEDAEALARGLRLRGNAGGTSRFLPEDPGPAVAQWDLAELLDFLEITDLYRPMVEDLQPEYEFWGGGAKGSGYVLEYSLSCVRPIPVEVGDFFSSYLSDYTRKRIEDA
ncbi:hypothetical protein [Nocardia jejuensis]|uniref:hypothetical protein n=1 Tax=Nocardia jejuensis TaxID=328049 RepID=UPI0008333727|nr:hypothetical protein [Nocardia jejuensis]